MPQGKAKPLWIIILLIAALAALTLVGRLSDKTRQQSPSGKKTLPVPVEVATIQRGPLSLQRTFSGTIEPRSQFIVAPKVSGRIQRLHVDVADSVNRGQLVAQLDDGEFRQEVVEAQARRAVAEANHLEAVSRLEISQRQRNRTKSLHQRGIASDSTLDAAQAEFLASQATVKVTEATLKQAQASLTAAEVRLGYTQIKTDWQQGDDQRTVAERFADEGNTVAANTPLFSIVELDPLIAVIQVTERDYPRLAAGQEVRLRTDAFPNHDFSGTVSRIAPIFRKSSRQARVEIDVPNNDHLLKPGMFSRCTLVLERLDDAVSVPEMAITRRHNQTGVFLVGEDGASVTWQEVQPGLKDGNQVQLIDTSLSGRVVTLGQQLLEDGSSIRISNKQSSLPGGTGTP